MLDYKANDQAIFFQQQRQMEILFCSILYISYT